jgi:hypothetical protein
MNTTLEEECRLTRLRVENTCRWMPFDDAHSTFDTACGCRHVFAPDSLGQYWPFGFEHCPYCNKKIDGVRYGHA